MQKIINIHGLIGSDEDYPDEPHFSYADALMAVSNLEGFTSIMLDIASDGGVIEEGEKIRDILKAQKLPIFSRNSGNVASMATVLFTIPPFANRMFYADKGLFLIHLPLIETMGNTPLNSDDFDFMSSHMKEINKTFISWYASNTTANATVIEGFMREDKPLTAEQIDGLGFAKVVQSQIKAIAKISTNHNNNKMEVKELDAKLSGFEKILAKLEKFLKPKAVIVNDSNGTELEFPELTSIDQVAEGATVNADGSPASGTFTMPNGKQIVAENGVVTQVIEGGGDDMEALKAENDALKAELETLKASNAQAQTAKADAEKTLSEVTAQFADVKAKFTALKNEFSGGNPQGGTPPQTSVEPKTFTYKKGGKK